MLPHVDTAQAETREFLQKVIDILLDYVNACNNRDEKILEFHHPEEMKTLLDFDINENGAPLQQLIVDCATTLKYQVKTGESEYISNYQKFHHKREIAPSLKSAIIIHTIKTHQNSILACDAKRNCPSHKIIC